MCVCLFDLFDSLRPSQQFLCYVGTGLPVLMHTADDNKSMENYPVGKELKNDVRNAHWKCSSCNTEGSNYKPLQLHH